MPCEETTRSLTGGGWEAVGAVGEKQTNGRVHVLEANLH